MSWGAERILRRDFRRLVFHHAQRPPSVTFLASTGDSGAPGEYPAYSPNVIAVGGTTLYLNTDNNGWQSETAWSGSGGGQSTYESEPSLSRGRGQSPAGGRSPTSPSTPTPYTGVAVYDSYDLIRAIPGGKSAAPVLPPRAGPA